MFQTIVELDSAMSKGKGIRLDGHDKHKAIGGTLTDLGGMT